MEYCEKSTLRDTIDQGLYQDVSRLWRLFREILDGLSYIHEQVNMSGSDGNQTSADGTCDVFYLFIFS